jgi:2-succinyl-6-hydroxy-2,4-cyclohexadiene-1-carboxylate synthase
MQSGKQIRLKDVSGSCFHVRYLASSDEVSVPTILALHGFTGSGLDFLPLREALGPDPANWLLPDFKGHGESDSPDNPDAYSLNTALDSIERVRNLAPDPDNVLLLGYSMGGRIALHYLRRHTQLHAFLIGSSPGLVTNEERTGRIEMDDRWRQFLLAGTHSVETFCENWESQPLIQPQNTLPDPLRRDIKARRRDNNPTGLAHSLYGLGTAALPELWSQLETLPPVHLVHGQRDVKFGEIARLMSEQNPAFEIHAIADSGHSPHLENPTVTAGYLARVLGHMAS